MLGHRVIRGVILTAVACFTSPLALFAADIPLGAVRWVSPPLETDDIRGAVVSQGLVHVVGNEGRVGKRELFDPASGLLADPEVFWSQDVALNGGAGGDSRSAVLGVNLLNDGRVIYLGASAADSYLNNTPTYWFGPETPIAGAGISVTGELLTATSIGVIAGSNDFQASVGSLTQKMIHLPGNSGGVQVYDSTSDGRYLVGPGIFRHIGPGELDYEIVNLTGWENVPGALEGVPSVFPGVRKLGSDYFVAGEVLSAETLESQVAVWNIETGELVLTTEPDDHFADLEVIEDQLVLAVNGLTGPAIYAGLGSSRNELDDELGFDYGQFSGFWNGLFPGDELGLIIRHYEGPFFVPRVYSIDFLAPPIDETLDVATTVEQGLYPENVVSLRTSTFNVTLFGAADLDVRQLDRSTLFIGDERHTTSGVIRSLRYSDVNGDGLTDAVVRVETASALLSDTSTLRITFQTTDGTKCDGSRSVISTDLTWWQYRFQRTARQAAGSLAQVGGWDIR